MPIATRVKALATRVGQEIKTLKARVTALEVVPPAPVVRAVFVGSSNVADGTTPINMWPHKLCEKRGWVKHNFAIAGSAFTNANNFNSQIDSAWTSLTPTQRLEVKYVFVGDGSNNARGKTPASEIVTATTSLLSNIESKFPGAQTVIVPMIWPADTEKYAPTAFPYEQIWNWHMITQSEAIKRTIMPRMNVLFIDESWTWLTGHDGYMNAPNDVHPNAAGNSVIAGYVDRALNGEPIVGSQPWSIVVPSGSANLGGRGRDLAARRRGWNVSLEGSCNWKIASGSNWDIAIIPYGLRPTYNQPIAAMRGDTFAAIPAEVWPNGAVRIYQALPAGVAVFISGAYQLG